MIRRDGGRPSSAVQPDERTHAARSLVSPARYPPCHSPGTHAYITEHRKAEAERERLIGELQAALADVRTLSGLVPICASCKRIRDDKGYWTQLEAYIQARTPAHFSHGICPECAQRLLSENDMQGGGADGGGREPPR